MKLKPTIFLLLSHRILVVHTASTLWFNPDNFATQILLSRYLLILTRLSPRKLVRDTMALLWSTGSGAGLQSSLDYEHDDTAKISWPCDRGNIASLSTDRYSDKMDAEGMALDKWQAIPEIPGYCWPEIKASLHFQLASVVRSTRTSQLPPRHRTRCSAFLTVSRS